MKVGAKRQNGAAVEVDYEFGDNLRALAENFGEETTFNHARGSLVVSLQGWLRSQLDAGKTPPEILKAVKEWKPGQRRQGKSAAEKIREAISKMDPEARAALMKEYRQQPKAVA